MVPPEITEITLLGKNWTTNQVKGCKNKWQYVKSNQDLKLDENKCRSEHGQGNITAEEITGSTKPTESDVKSSGDKRSLVKNEEVTSSVK